jgi:hypothetical protein
MTWYEVCELEESYKSGTDFIPVGPRGWSFVVSSEPIDEGAPHRLLLEAIHTFLPGMTVELRNADGSGNYLEGEANLGGMTANIWSELLEGTLVFWSVDRGIIETLRVAAIQLAPALF